MVLTAKALAVFLVGVCIVAGVKCCLSSRSGRRSRGGSSSTGRVYQEDPCHGLGGTCKLDSLACSGGTYQSGKCPTQSASVRCCVPRVKTNFVALACAGMSCPRLVTRAEWGARRPRGRRAIGNNLPYWFVHHTVSQECDSLSRCSEIVRGIQNYHMDQRGFNDIGYSFLVGGDGNIYEGRGFNVEGAHTLGYNRVGYGSSFIGDFSNRSPTSAAIDAAKRHIQCSARLGKVTPTYKLYGHRQVNAGTVCPGDTLYAIVKTWPHWTPVTP